MDIILLIVALLLGAAAGIVTGLIPGIHTNTVAVLMLAILPMLSIYFSMLAIAVFLISMITIHSFLDFIPSIFLGAPDAETALSVLPGHNLLLKGEGYKALKLTVIGGVGTFLIALVMLPAFFLFLKATAEYLKYVVAPLLVIIAVHFIIKEKTIRNKIWAILIFLMSGILGLVVLDNLPIKEPLFPMLSGLFGISVLLLGMKRQTKIPKQKTNIKIKLSKKRGFSNYIKAVIAAGMMSFLPALGPAQAAVVAQEFVGFKKIDDFLITLGGINTADALLTLAALLAIGKARSGVMVAISQIITIDLNTIVILIAACFAAIGLAVILTLKIGKIFANNINKVNYKLISILIIIIIASLVTLLTGLLGLLILTVATGIGLLAPLVGCSRVHAMACLIVPVVVYYL